MIIRNEIKNEEAIPKGWKNIPFGELVNKSSKKFDCQKSNENKICIELEHIQESTGRIIGSTSTQNQKSTKNCFSKGQVVFGKLRPYLKKYFLASFDGVASSETWVLEFKNKLCDNRFLYYLIQSNDFIEKCNRTTGTKMPRAEWSLIIKELFYLPPYEEQSKIADIFSIWDKSIETLEKLIAAKEKRKCALMQKLLTGKVRFKEFKGEKWVTLTLENLTALIKDGTHGTHLEEKNGIPLLSAKDIVDGEILIPNDCRRISQMDFEQIHRNYSIQNGDILLTIVGTIGRCAIVKNISKLFTVQRSVAIIRTDNEKLLPEYLYQLFTTQKLQLDFSKKANASAQAGIYLGELNKLLINLPSNVQEQEKIAKVLSDVDIEIQIMNDKLEFYTNQKKGLMQVLLTGKIRVKI